MQAAACKEVNALTSPGTLRTLTFTRPKVQWKKPAPASGGLPPIGWRRMFALLQDGDRIMQQALQDPSVCDGLSLCSWEIDIYRSLASAEISSKARAR
eukprot:g13334.t1